MKASALKKVLVVDDDPSLRKMISIALRGMFDLFEASDGGEALTVLKVQRPKLLLLDIAMPTMSGIEVLQAALHFDPSLIVIMLTGEDDVGVAKHALEMGAVMYMTKPFDVDDLRAEVKRLLAPEKQDPYRPWQIAS